MKNVYIALIGLSCAALGTQRVSAIAVEELGNGPAEYLMIEVTGIGKIPVGAGVLKLDIGGTMMDGFCIDPFHFSSGPMTGYQAVDLTGAPKDRFMSANTATQIERLWGSYYNPNMSAADAAGLQIAIWELTGGSDFRLCSHNDYGAAGFLAAVQDPNYSGPLADLIGLTGSGQDYAVQNFAGSGVRQTVPDAGSTLGLLSLAVFGIMALCWKAPRLAVVRA